MHETRGGHNLTAVGLTDALVPEADTEDRQPVAAELAVPLSVGSRPVGILNVDAPSRIDGQQLAAVMSAANLLEQTFKRVGVPWSGESPSMVLGRFATRVARAYSTDTLALAGVEAAVAISTLDTAGLWFEQQGVFELVACRGDDVDTLGSGFSHQRISGWRARVPVPEQGASTRIRSN